MWRHFAVSFTNLVQFINGYLDGLSKYPAGFIVVVMAWWPDGVHIPIFGVRFTRLHPSWVFERALKAR